MAASKLFHYRWEWHLTSDPERLWPLVADTNHFDRDAGLPAYAETDAGDEILTNSRRKLRVNLYGVPLDYVEEPFEWIRPYRFGVIRTFLPGPIPGIQPLAYLRILARLRPDPGGGTHLVYEVWAKPRNLLGYLAIPLQIGLLNKRKFAATFREYDRLAASHQTFLDLPGNRVRFPPGGRQRLAQIGRVMTDAGTDSALIERMVQLIEAADDLTLNKLRPYSLAALWNVPRRPVLEMALLATRLGMLDFRWDLLCPLCRVAKDSVLTLADIGRGVHCDTCNIDYTANFEQSVELTFRPNEAVRLVDERVEFCTAGPQAMPHVVLQQLLSASESRTIAPLLEPGRYRIRTLALPGMQLLSVSGSGLEGATFRADAAGWPAEEIHLARSPAILLENGTEEEQLFVMERLAWTDEAVTAAEVTTLQRFRDLFANEALRPGDRISVGTLSILFTDLRDSTRMYLEIGDAPAFGVVMNHFDVLREAIAAEDGAIVKTIGDAVMAVFRRPISALRAILAAQRILQDPPDGMRPLQLKAAIHVGPCIAVTLNERLDYFGSVVNAASRLESFSLGDDVILTEAVVQDPEVSEFLSLPSEALVAQPFVETLRGFDQERFDLWRVTRAGRGG